MMTSMVNFGPIRELPGSRLVVLGLGWACLASACDVGGKTPELRPLLTSYNHAGWSQHNGLALGAVSALAQTSNGYLWLGTDKGLIRFDGLKTLTLNGTSGASLPSNKITQLLSNDHGELWVGTSRGIALLDSGGAWKPVSAPAGVIPSESVEAMAQDGKNKLWLSFSGRNSNKLIRIAGGVVTSYAVPNTLVNGAIFTISRDTEDSLSIGGPGGFCSWKPGEPACKLFRAGSTIGALTRDESGELIVADATQRGLFRQQRGGLLAKVVSDWGGEVPVITSVLVDRDHAIWVGTLAQGLYRLEDCQVDHFTTKDGLTNDSVRALLEDHEGNIWAGTARGMDRFSRRKVSRWSTHEGLSSNLITAVLATTNGDVWIGTAIGLSRMNQSRQVTLYTMDSGLPGKTILSLAEDSSRSLWVGTSAGLAKFERNRFVPILEEGTKRLDRVFLMVPKPEGGLFLVDGQEGLLEAHDSEVRPASIRQHLPKTGISQLVVDRQHRLWIGSHQGGVAVATGGNVQSYEPQHGMAAGRVTRILETQDATIWVSTESALCRFRNGRWTQWTTVQGLPEGGVNDIVEDRLGALWLLTPSGIVRASLVDLAKSPDGTPQILRLDGPYGPSDGIAMGDAGTMTNPRSTVGSDGVLWVRSEDGLAALDPARLSLNRIPPPVVIEQLFVDGKPLDPKFGELSFHGRDMQISYTALSLTSPETVRFRYRLQAPGADWVDALGAHQVSYAKLLPGKYRFEVTACNNDGLWNPAAATLDFRIDPYFHETRTFWALCTFAVGLAVYGSYRMRLHSMQSRLQLIVDERARLTREVHDTLLQGFAGVVYQLEAVARQLHSDPVAAEQRLQRALDRADQALADARTALSSIDTPALRHATLPEAIQGSAKEMMDGTSIKFHLSVKGILRELPPEIQVNLYIIAREAIGNAITHAKPLQVRTLLEYGPWQVALRVEDDGIGFDPAAALLKEKHWGLRSMRDRAKHIGAEYKLETKPGEGTRILVISPIRSHS